MARHASHPSRRFALSAGLTVAAVAAAVGAGDTAHAAPVPPGPLDSVASTLAGPTGGLPLAGAVTNSVTGLGELTRLQLNPLAKTGVDPLANGAAAQVADFKPISTQAATGPLAQGDSLSELPVLGPLVQGLPL
ncbi:hypothetical protein [Streptomyces yaizuensis]|uniref:ATP-binding protein n=1 Tax=Streptomyces yaizuensis TaxID=2989713 RepID=A0ABQ5NV79_9ACTN|nr:hypothetical protein [Streptomyces sp. YSPA8]GLF94261.1 hypothetical protein SYYSPA8_08210 [Streptomyces sp. YSPA8]